MSLFDGDMRGSARDLLFLALASFLVTASILGGIAVAFWFAEALGVDC